MMVKRARKVVGSGDRSNGTQAEIKFSMESVLTDNQ